MLTTIIKTKNSEETISEVLESVKDLGEIIILDGHSKDDTILLAKEYKANVIYSSAMDFSSAFQEALSQASNDWVLFLEGDEIIPEKLAQNILNYVEAPKKNKNDVFIPQKIFYLNKEIKAARCLKLKLFKKDSVELLNNFSSDLKPFKTKKHNLNKNFKQDKNCILKFEKRSVFTYLQNIIEENIIKSKENVSKKASVILKPFMRFLYFYFIKGAIFDGRNGFIYSILKYIDCFILQCNNFEKNKSDLF